MARRTKLWIAEHGRDKGKQFLLTEKSADAAESWAVRALLAIASAGVEVPEDSMSSGMAGVAAILRSGVMALKGLQYAALAPLLAEMMECVQIQPPGAPMPFPLNTGENCQVEEVRTFFALRLEVLELHLGFSLAAVVSTIPATPATPSAATE